MENKFDKPDNGVNELRAELRKAPGAFIRILVGAATLAVITSGVALVAVPLAKLIYYEFRFLWNLF